MKLIVYTDAVKSIGGEYEVISSLTYSPQLSITSETMYIDQLSCNIKINGTFNKENWLYAELKAENNTWFYGRIAYAEKEYNDIVCVVVQSELCELDYELDGKMYTSSTDVKNIINAITGFSSGITYDSSVNGKTVRGYFPKQTARERLQQLLFSTGLVIKFSLTGTPVVTAVNHEQEQKIPLEHTFWKPKVTYGDYVSKIQMTYFSFYQRTPQQGDEVVKDGDTEYVVTRHKYTLSNPYIPDYAEEYSNNEIVIDDVMTIMQANVDTIAANLARIYFKRISVDADIINNGEYTVGDKCTVYLNDTDWVTGYIEQADFSFGLQTRSRILLRGCELVELDKLTVVYKCVEEPLLNKVLTKKYFSFPINYQYDIDTIYLRLSFGNYIYVFRPLVDSVTGTMTRGKVETVECMIALKYNKNTKVLEVISVDEVTEISDPDGKIAEIA